jgi:hypothetical protein
LIVPRLGLKKQGFERQLGAITWMQVEIRCRKIVGSRGKDMWKIEIQPTPRQESSGRSLGAADQEITTAGLR